MEATTYTEATPALSNYALANEGLNSGAVKGCNALLLKLVRINFPFGSSSCL